MCACKKQSGLFLWCSNIPLPQNREGREAFHCSSKGLSQINVWRFFGLGIKSDHPSALSIWVLSLWNKSLFLRQHSQVTSECCVIFLFFFFFNETQGLLKKTKGNKEPDKMGNPSSHRSEVSLWQIFPASYMHCLPLSSSGEGSYFGWRLLLEFYL